jgi:hypothetical protein
LGYFVGFLIFLALGAIEREEFKKLKKKRKGENDYSKKNKNKRK